MADVLTDFVFKGRPRDLGMWTRYFDGQIWRLNGADIAGRRIEAVRATVISLARKRGLKVRTRIDGDALVIQSYKPEP